MSDSFPVSNLSQDSNDRVAESASMKNSWIYYSESFHSNVTLLNENVTYSDEDRENLTAFNQLFHQPIDLQFRIAVLWALAVLGILGNFLVLLWISAHRKCRSRINLLILHLTVADILVIAWATCPQLIWEYAQRQWHMSDSMCRLFKFLQTVAISVSNYMVVVLAIDRYCAIRRPLKKALSVSYMAGAAWTFAITLNLANFILYEKREINGEVFCRNILYDHPEIYLQAYITSIAVMVVILPFILICFIYARIFQKIATKAKESKKSKRSSIKTGKIHLQATQSSTLPKAKAKTFKMTIVIVVSFLLCSTPYFICDICRVYKGQAIPPIAWAILGALAVSNSSTNSFVFLVFNSTTQWWIQFFKNGGKVNRGRNFSGGTLHTQSEHLTLESIRIPSSGADNNTNVDKGPVTLLPEKETCLSQQPTTNVIISGTNPSITVTCSTGNHTTSSMHASGSSFAV